MPIPKKGCESPAMATRAVFLLGGPWRSAVSPLTCRHCQLCWLSSCSAKLCPLVNGPGWWGNLSLECLIACGGNRLCLVYPRVMSDSRVRSGYLDLVVVPLDIVRMEGHVAWRQIESYPKHEVQGCGCILQCFLIARNATGDVNRRGNRVFDICQKLFLGVKSCPGLQNFDRIWACAPRTAQTYVQNESSRRSTPACVKPSDLSRTNVVQAPEISRLWCMASFGWKNGPCPTCACLYAPDGVMKVLHDPSLWHPWSSFCR